MCLAWTTEKFIVGSALRTVLWGDQRFCRITISLVIFSGGMCGPAVITPRSGGHGFTPCPSHCFLRQGTLLHFVSPHPGV